MPPPIPVLFTHFGEDWLRGSENVLLDLLRHLDRERIAPVVWCNAAAMEEACRALGVATHRSRFEFYFDYSSPPFAPRQYAAQVAEAVALIRRHAISVLHSNSAAPTQWLVPAAAWTRRPLLTHLHIGYLPRSRYALLLHQADLVVGVADALTRPLLEDGMSPAQVRTIYNGIDPGRLVPGPGSLRARLAIPESAPLIGSIGSLILRKGHDVVLRAMASQGRGLEASHLVVAGSGPDEAMIRDEAERAGLGERVHFLGHLSDPGSLYAACDLFVLASRGEGLPLVLAEAGHFGLPCVSTRVGGIPEIVLDEETGLLVSPDDVGALATAMARLVADHALRRRLGEAARQRVAKHFTVHAMARAFTETYETLAVSPRGSRLAPSRLGCYWRLLRGRDAKASARTA